MKKILIFVFSLLMISSTCFAYDDVYEPEVNDAVSFSSYSVEKGWELTFVNYATKDNINEYWLRVSAQSHHVKILHYLTLYIDNVPYSLVAINDPGEKYTFAAQSIIDNSSTNGFFNSSIPHAASRYFILSPEIVNKLQSSTGAYLLLNTQNYINIRVNIPEKFLTNIKEIYSHKYADFSNYWKPKDLSQK